MGREGIKKGEIKGNGGGGQGLLGKEGPGAMRVPSQKELWLDVEGQVGLNFWVGGRSQAFWDLGP